MIALHTPGGVCWVTRAPIGGPERADKMTRKGNKILNRYFSICTPDERRFMRRAYRMLRKYECVADARLNTMWLMAP